MDGKLYIVPTPIGNLEDITLRALRILKEVDLILAEDTRTSKKLLKHYEINNALASYHMHNEHDKVAALVKQIQEGKTIALISDAGTPGISDPGYLLVLEATKNNVEVECLPGATALIPALVQSALPTDKFSFYGFLPQKKGRKTIIEQIGKEDRTVVLYESPHRMKKLVEQLLEYIGDRPFSYSREISKLHHEQYRGTVKEALNHLEENIVKGEYVVVIGRSHE
jgi:16S rRNA (cytidine1402-2'-O)-methyltransferase